MKTNILERVEVLREKVGMKILNVAVSSGGCYEYMGRRDINGYGIISLYSKDFLPCGLAAKASRVAWTYYNKSDPGEFFVCHHCDNPACIRASHLYLGTPKKNLEDASARLRMRHGERHYKSKLTDQDVVEIRRRLDNSERITHIAKDFEVDRTVIYRIRDGKTWKHVPWETNSRVAKRDTYLVDIAYIC